MIGGGGGAECTRERREEGAAADIRFYYISMSDWRLSFEIQLQLNLQLVCISVFLLDAGQMGGSAWVLAAQFFVRAQAFGAVFNQLVRSCAGAAALFRGVVCSK